MDTLNQIDEWHKVLRQFKEKLAERLWAIPTVTETEKELVYKEYLSDLHGFESVVGNLLETIRAQKTRDGEENDLLRSLLGIPENELRNRILALESDLTHTTRKFNELKEEHTQACRDLAAANEENKTLREKLKSIETKNDDVRVQEIKKRHDDIKYFSETNEGLKNQLKDLEARLSNLRLLYTENNQQLVTEKQNEIAVLQKSLFEEMENALRRKQDVMLAEEELFARGIAHKVRTALVSAQGQLYLSLERLGLMDPETKTEAFWKARFRLLVEGAGELSQSFKAISSQLQDVTSTLDDYLHLTGRRNLTREPVDLKELIQEEVARVYIDRRPTLSLEVLSDDPLPSVQGDREMLQFVFKTLLQNALEALPQQSGKIIINIKNMSQRGVVHVVVHDSGIGFPPSFLPRIFQPFLTTKDGRQGLNLSRAKRYVELHGGLLDLVSSGPEGTTFQIELPLKGKLA
jgi:signal transduction histidine kinase